MDACGQSLKNPFGTRMVGPIRINQENCRIEFLRSDLGVLRINLLGGLVDHPILGYVLPSVNPESTKSARTVINQNGPLIVNIQVTPQRDLFSIIPTYFQLFGFKPQSEEFVPFFKED